ncbi:hypothetical protein D1AOALGA4SA_4800 [Olavius algarvensis Delta 1 endosymbiont]|nr:hypothetical protein D1AOALGA4SA_4800 [Olavius algarvensis Delta 1 endosymbiont]
MKILCVAMLRHFLNCYAGRRRAQSRRTLILQYSIYSIQSLVVT